MLPKKHVLPPIEAFRFRSTRIRVRGRPGHFGPAGEADFPVGAEIIKKGVLFSHIHMRAMADQ
jgi:hypothetical protein